MKHHEAVEYFYLDFKTLYDYSNGLADFTELSDLDIIDVMVVALNKLQQEIKTG